MTITCGNCKFFDEHKKMVNNSYMCSFHHFTTNPQNMGCYMIQKSRIRNKEY